MVQTMAEYIDREALEKAMTIAAANGKDKGGMTSADDRCGRSNHKFWLRVG